MKTVKVVTAGTCVGCFYNIGINLSSSITCATTKHCVIDNTSYIYLTEKQAETYERLSTGRQRYYTQCLDIVNRERLAKRVGVKLLAIDDDYEYLGFTPRNVKAVVEHIKKVEDENA